MENEPMYSISEDGIKHLFSFIDREFTVDEVSVEDINLDKFKKLDVVSADALLITMIIWNMRIKNYASVTKTETMKMFGEYRLRLGERVLRSEGFMDDNNSITESGTADILAKFATDIQMRKVAYRQIIEVTKEYGADKRVAAVVLLADKWAEANIMDKDDTLKEFYTILTEEYNANE